jgi:integrase
MPKRKRNRDGIFDRGDGWLYLQHKDKRVSLRTKDPEVAAIRASDHKRRTADPAETAAHKKSLAEACAEFRSYARTGENRRKPPAPATFEMYETHFSNFAGVWGETLAVGAIDALAVDHYIETRRSEYIGKDPEPGQPETRRTVSASTVDKELGTLRQILALGLRRGWYHLPLERVLPASAGGAYVPLERALTWDQLPLLLAQLAPGRAATCAYIVAFGADWCAVERAELDDLGSDVSCALRCLVRGTKNAKRHAEVPVVPPFGPLAEQARAWLAQHGAFPRWGKQRCRDLAAACRRAGVPRVTPRDLRRTHGQILADRGVPPYLIGEMLRHADSRMAERVYGQRTREAVGRQVAAVTGTKTGTVHKKGQGNAA